RNIITAKRVTGRRANVGAERRRTTRQTAASTAKMKATTVTKTHRAAVRSIESPGQRFGWSNCRNAVANRLSCLHGTADGVYEREQGGGGGGGHPRSAAARRHGTPAHRGRGPGDASAQAPADRHGPGGVGAGRGGRRGGGAGGAGGAGRGADFSRGTTSLTYEVAN